MTITATPYSKFTQKLLDNSAQLDQLAVTLHTSSYTPLADVDATFADATNEVSNGSGYTTGGKNLASITSGYDSTGHFGYIDAADVTWTALTKSFRYAVLRQKLGGPTSADLLVSYIDFGTTESIVAEDLVLQWAAPTAGAVYMAERGSVIIGGGGMALDSSYPIDATYGDHFDGASLNGRWTRHNFTGGAETYQAGPGATYMRVATASRAIGDGYFQTAPGGDWTIAMATVPRFFYTLSPPPGLAVVDSAGSGLSMVWYGSPLALLLIATTTYSTYGGTFQGVGSPSSNVMDVGLVRERKVWQSLRKSGTSYYAAYSLDGELWSPESAAMVWAGTVDRVGFIIPPLGAVGGANPATVFDIDWFNKIA